jgi:lipopolysaccharide transport system ATP-binding protein
MGDVAIRVQGLGKQYRIGRKQEAYDTLRDTLADAFRAPFRRAGRLLRGQAAGAADLDETIWALKNVSVEVKRGEVVGIIGHNGAGKTTLLKILSRITEPTEGYADIYGRVGSLLEVGTGFHKELTGRDNIYLNGAILGMTRAEIDRKFDEIVDFSGVEKFIDTPVKHYSTGMYLRLAFSVAAHLEPEILLIDEVLAVGDAVFQKKCLGRMNEVAKEGRTVLFVSHNMAAVQQLTRTCLLLEDGRLASNGITADVINRYLSTSMDHSTTVYHVEKAPRRFSHLRRQVEFLKVELEDHPTALIRADEVIPVRITVLGNESVDKFRFSGTIYKIDGTPVGNMRGPEIHSIKKGEVATFRMELCDHRLAPGKYYAHMATGTGDIQSKIIDFDIIDDVLYFEMMGPEGVGGTRSVWSRSWGSIRFKEPRVIRIA